MNGDVVCRELTKDDVSVVQTMGSDLAIYQAARVSYDSGDDVVDDDKLKEFIGKLYKNKHLVPFEDCYIQYKIHAPIFVFRQLFRYRATTIHEMSLRYKEATGEFCIPFGAENKEEYIGYYERSWENYVKLLEAGESKERARTVLPVATFSSATFGMNLRNLFNLWDQRISDHAQPDIRFVAGAMFDLAKELYPIACGAYWNGRVGEVVQKDVCVWNK